MAWKMDVEVENTPLTTTGGHTWRAAYRLADYLSASAPHLGLDAPGVNILELGAGCGWLGATVARNLPNAALVCLTEQEDGGACDWLRHNIQTNRERGVPLDAVIVQPCDWLLYSYKNQQISVPQHPLSALPEKDGEDDCVSSTAQASALDLSSIAWDFIIGSDLVYNTAGTEFLPRLMATLAHPNKTQIIYSQTKHRYDLLDIDFFGGLAEEGLSWEEVWEPGVPAPVESPPAQFPPTSLFPEQRIAVYRIALKRK